MGYYVPLVLAQLSLLLFSCTSTLSHIHAPVPAPSPIYFHHHSPAPAHGGHHHHHHPAPTKSPVYPPAHPPAKAPAHPPAKSPAPSRLPPRKLVAVQGVVYCKPCKYAGVPTFNDAKPLKGAVVKLQCNNTKIGLTQKATTDKNGYFWMSPNKGLTTAAFHKCKVFLVSSPSKNCTVPTNIHYGSVGAVLIPEKKMPAKEMLFQQFTVGPFAFDPVKTYCTL